MILANSNRETGAREDFCILRRRLPVIFCAGLLPAGTLAGPRSIANHVQILDATVQGRVVKHSGGARIRMALKSGANRFHGTACEFFGNAALSTCRVSE